MANTKKLPAKERRAAKRNGRRELKKLAHAMSSKQRTAFRKQEKGLKAFLAEAAKSEG